MASREFLHRFQSELPPLLRQTLEHSILQTSEKLKVEQKNLNLVLNVVTSWAGETVLRGEDAESPELEQARNYCADFFDFQLIKATLCMDSRTSSVLEMGRPPRYGGATRYLGAKPFGIMIGKNTAIHTDNNAYIRNVDTEFRQNARTIHVHDSHMYCAARGDEETTAAGNAGPDGGLKADYKFRKLFINSLKDRAERKFGIAPIMIHHSFNPKNGDMLFGLDAPSLLNSKRIPYYTEEMIDNLSAREIIISTKHLTANYLRPIFDRYFFKADFVNDYKNSMLNFWTNLAAVKDEVYPIIYDALQETFQNLGRPISYEDLDAAVKIAAANSYISYLHTDSSGNYRFNKHEESLGLVTHGEDFGPFNMNPLSIEATGDFTQQFRLVQRVIRAAREDKKGYVTDPSRIIPMVIVSRVNSDLSAENLRDILGELDLSRINVPSSVYLPPNTIEARLLEEFGDIPFEIISAMRNLIQLMNRVYSPSHSGSNYVYRRSIFPIPILTDNWRKPLVALPIEPPELDSI